jgi:hypothetical protein
MELIIILLAVWRLTHLIQAEDGPFDLIYKLRELAGNSVIGKLMDCFYCLSIWISLIPGIYYGNSIINKILLTLSFSGGAIILEKLTNKNV